MSRILWNPLFSNSISTISRKTCNKSICSYNTWHKICKYKYVFSSGSFKDQRNNPTQSFFYNKRNIKYIHTSPTRYTKDPYSVLGVSRNATNEEIKRKFRELAKKYHPDLNPSPDAKQKMAQITRFVINIYILCIAHMNYYRILKREKSMIKRECKQRTQDSILQVN